MTMMLECKLCGARFYSNTKHECVKTDSRVVELLEKILDRLPDRGNMKVEPAPADGLPGEPVKPGDLRAGDRVEFTLMGERIACTLVSSSLGDLLYSDAPLSSGLLPNVVESGEWRDGISDVRLIERAPREDDAERALDNATQRVLDLTAERDEWKARHEALREDVERGAHHWSTFASTDRHRQRIARAAGEDLTEYLTRDDERAKGEDDD